MKNIEKNIYMVHPTSVFIVFLSLDSFVCYLNKACFHIVLYSLGNNYQLNVYLFILSSCCFPLSLSPFIGLSGGITSYIKHDVRVHLSRLWKLKTMGYGKIHLKSCGLLLNP